MIVAEEELLPTGQWKVNALYDKSTVQCSLLGENIESICEFASDKETNQFRSKIVPNSFSQFFVFLTENTQVSNELQRATN